LLPTEKFAALAKARCELDTDVNEEWTQALR
jgi:hypothetical protein